MLVEQVGEEGDGLDGLPQPHLISQDNAVAPTSGTRIFFFMVSELIIKINHCDCWQITCTRSEPASSIRPAGNLLAEGSRLQYKMAVSLRRQTWAFALIPDITGSYSTFEVKDEAVFWWLCSTSYLAVFRGDGFTGVSAHEAIDPVLKLLANQSPILPAALRVRQTHPLA